ncbi:helix-turn-helix domain-containing protein [Streptococcus intermedius]|uniref:helix-turn-helix domain-containing protein n=1 Tax=Streptococcus intermedius TaxID=1338 RepID=UPI0020010C41|nr:helix-turn-helix domain-containing protein [Streptococcus intermedius]
MALLSNETETSLKMELLETVDKYLKARNKALPHITGLMTAQQVMTELDIKYKTLQRWEKAGLRRYQPPLEDTRKIYYRVSDLLKFLGVENG